MATRPNLLTGGLALTLRAWPAFVWTYIFNIGLAFAFSIPLHQQLSALTAHSLESQSLAKSFDLGTMFGLFLKMGEGPGPATAGSYFSTPIYLLLYFLIVPGTLLSYQTGAPARLSTLFQTGFVFFWRFVRITLVSVILSGLVLAGLMALQKLWSTHIDESMVGRSAFLLENAGLLIVLLVAALLRLYFDLVQIYTVQLSLQIYPAGVERKKKPERQIRRAFKPAWRTLRGNFLGAYFTFLCLALIGVAAVVLTARMALHSLAQPSMALMFFLAQGGLLLMLFTRFWQRGAETVLAQSSPLLLSTQLPETPVTVTSLSAEPETVRPVLSENEGETSPNGPEYSI